LLMGEVLLYTKGRPNVLFSEQKIYFGKIYVERRVSEHVRILVDLSRQ
jgi:hypothetical protein